MMVHLLHDCHLNVEDKRTPVRLWFCLNRSMRTAPVRETVENSTPLTMISKQYVIGTVTAFATMIGTGPATVAPIMKQN
jgi:hypothetical protein